MKTELRFLDDRHLFDWVYAGMLQAMAAYYKAMDEYWAEAAGTILSDARRSELLKKASALHDFKFEAYVTLAKDVEEGDGVMRSGTKLRVVLASNMGDLCLSRDLSGRPGYDLRLTPGQGYMTDCVAYV